MQRKVSRDMQKKAAIKAMARATVSASESSLPVESIDWDDDNSPNGVSSMTEEEWKPKKHQLNAKQRQEKHEEALQGKENHSVLQEPRSNQGPRCYSSNYYLPIT
jgi:hypothetical protein